MIRNAAAACALALTFAAPAAHAALFEDSDARRHILELREKLKKVTEQQAAQEADNAATAEQITQLKRSLLDLNTQLENARAEIARLRGQGEQLARDVADVQRSQKDIRQGIDDRMRKLEPQSVSVDGREFVADPEETRQFDDALATLRKGEFGAAATALSAFQRRFPTSGYNPSAIFWLGNAQYGKREYKEAMASFRNLVGNWPDHPRAPEALLSAASCLTELKDAKGARRTLDDVVKLYPRSEAAQAAKERLASMK
jgi:tol-pal system protein YbgF